MQLKEIYVKDFRNYEEQRLVFHEKINLLTGSNGQGKTNLLEAIYTLSMGKSFRTSRETEMIRFEADFLRVEGSFRKEGRKLVIEVMLSKNEKRFKIDGFQGTKNADLLENAYMVSFSPEDLRIVKDDPEKRRRFIDRELFQIRPLYYKDLSKYKKSLLQRNALLKRENPGEDMLAVWDAHLTQHGTRIMKERGLFIEKLSRVSGRIHAGITGEKETLSLRYESNIEKKGEPDFSREAFAAKLAETREKDLYRGYTDAGPHRDDLCILVNGTDVRHFGSQGQQRTAALSLKLAELQIIKEETGEEAIILLDDVFSELDGERQQFLIRSLSENQIFLSAAEISGEILERLPRGDVFHVKEGRAAKKE
ncbi:MAG: DNA replication/repair protein RecF [Clostridiales Family XIII bacterium]|jgi:DNA replication and repair protein RecF|nr:DNA replication/repair protein RecF [Clostridiales Family XIII bacterium]